MIATSAPTNPGSTRTQKVRRMRVGWIAALLLAAVALIAGIVLPASAASRSVAFVIVPTQSVIPGGTARFPFAVRTSGGVGTVSFTVSGAPAGSVTNVTPLGNGNYSLAVAVPTTAAPGASTLTLRTKSAAPSKSTTLRLNVEAGTPQPPVTTTAPPTTRPPITVPPTSPPISSGTFALRADNPEISVRTGQAAAFGFTVDRSGGYSGRVTFTAQGFPAGVTANFSPNPTTAGTVLYATAPAGVPEGRYAVTISGSSDTQTVRTATVVFVVSNPADFALVVPAATTVSLGGTTAVLVGYQIVGVSAPVVSLGVNGLPSGVTVNFTPNPATGDSTLAFFASAATQPGSYALGIVGLSGAISHTYPMTLNVISTTTGPTPIGGYGLSATPFSLAMPRGSSANYAVVITPTGGFASSITFNLSGLPAGVGVTVSGALPNFALLVTVPLTVAAGKYPLILTGTSGTLSAAVTLELNVL